MNNGLVKILLVGLLGGFVGNGVLGALFSSPSIKAILYNPEWQSQLFINITPKHTCIRCGSRRVKRNPRVAFQPIEIRHTRTNLAEQGVVLGNHDLADVLALSRMVYLQHATR